MSNHSGSYMLQEVLTILEHEQVFEKLGKERSRQIVLDIIKIACKRFDCNYGEILEGHAARLGICMACLKPSEQISERGWCIQCEKELGR